MKLPQEWFVQADQGVELFNQKELWEQRRWNCDSKLRMQKAHNQKLYLDCGGVKYRKLSCLSTPPSTFLFSPPHSVQPSRAPSPILSAASTFHQDFTSETSLQLYNLAKKGITKTVKPRKPYKIREQEPDPEQGLHRIAVPTSEEEEQRAILFSTGHVPDQVDVVDSVQKSIQ
jgi:hypothetical protein